MNLLDWLKQVLGLTDAPAESVPAAPPRPAPPKRAPTAVKPAKPKRPKVAALLNLDASDLLPITHDEMRASMQELIRTGGFRFTGRGFIPVGDERTRLINRALLTNNLLTPDQLAEINRVAEDYERMRKGVAAVEQAAAQAGESAVVTDREARARIKVQKKAEAAERRRQHQEGVAHRKATDIVFLGPGVSARLGQRDSDEAKLRLLNLPILRTPADVATAMNVPVSQLRWLAFHAEVATRIHYVHFTVPKRGGGVRTLSAPHRKLAAAQKWVFTNILDRLPVEPPAHGFVAGRGVVTNAEPHVGRAIVVNMDLESFFPSVGFARVRSVFHRLGYSPAVATVLALLGTECPREPVVYAGQTYYVAVGPRGLPQGACTSPGLSNQVARRLDKRLGGLARKLGLTYTRYADDLTFSGDAAFDEKVGYLMARVRHLAQDEGFAVNEKKSRVLRRNTAQVVTGVVVNAKPSLPRKELRRLRAILHRARTAGLEAQNREGRPDFRAWLRGKIAYVKMVRPDLGAKMLAQFLALAH